MRNPGVLPDGTVQTPNYHECGWPADVQGDVSLQTRLFTYKTARGIVSGAIWNVMFTLDRPAKQVWPYVKDWNLWMNDYGYYWPGVVGDLYRREERDFEKGTFPITVKKPNPNFPTLEAPIVANHYQLLSVIPEHLIVMYEPIVEGDDRGGVSPGMHVFTLNEREGKTVVTIFMEHAHRTQDKTQEEAIASWREGAKEIQRFWRESFVPILKRLVYEGK